jgi:predicted MFS family arabinose efflux permease
MTRPLNRSGAHMLPVVLALGITQTIGYGTLYYAFGLLAPRMAEDTGYSLTAVYGIFSLALLTSGVAAPFVGKALDRFNPGRAMALGSLASAVALAFWTLLPGKAAFAIFAIAVEVMSVLVLYEAAFVLAARLIPDRARRTITGITLIAGFASTIFWPLTAWLAGFFTWREIYLVYAALNLAVCLPLHLWLAGRHARRKARVDDGSADVMADARLTSRGMRRVVFTLLMFAFSAIAFVMSAVHLHLIGLLAALGLSGSAAFIGALIGPAQVAGRFMEFIAGERVNVLHVSVLAAAALPVALVILALGAPALAAAVVFAAVFGIGQGLSYIVRGVLPLHLFGLEAYGALTGQLNSARLFVSAAAPFVTAALFEAGGANAALTMLAVVGAAGAAGLAALYPLLKRARGKPV